MTDDLHNANDVLKELEGLTIKTTAGEFVKMEDVRRLIEKRNEARELTDKEAPNPKTPEQARMMARKFLKDQGFGQQGPKEPGRSIPANESQPSSRT